MINIHHFQTCSINQVLLPSTSPLKPVGRVFPSEPSSKTVTLTWTRSSFMLVHMHIKWHSSWPRSSRRWRRVWIRPDSPCYRTTWPRTRCSRARWLWRRPRSPPWRAPRGSGRSSAGTSSSRSGRWVKDKSQKKTNVSNSYLNCPGAVDGFRDESLLTWQLLGFALLPQQSISHGKWSALNKSEEFKVSLNAMKMWLYLPH